MKLTERAEWKVLEQQAATVGGRHLRELFADDPQRAERMTVAACGWRLDYSKNRVTDATLAALRDLAAACGVEGLRDRMLAGERINTTEDRAVLPPLATLRPMRLQPPAPLRARLVTFR